MIQTDRESGPVAEQPWASAIAPAAAACLFVTAASNDPSYRLEATAFGSVHLDMIMTLKITASVGDGMIVLHNAADPRRFHWYLQPLR